MNQKLDDTPPKLVFAGKVTPSNSHLTPCRRMGLSRGKKSSNTPIEFTGVTITTKTESSGSKSQLRSIDNFRNKPEADEKRIDEDGKQSNLILPQTPLRGYQKLNRKRLSLTGSGNPTKKAYCSTDEGPSRSNTSLKVEITSDDLDMLRSRIHVKREKVKSMQSEHTDIEKLESLIALWKNGCREVLEELLKATEGYKDYNMLLDMLKIPYELIGYDPITQEFTD